MDIEKVLGEYGDYLLRVAYLYVKDENIAEDIVQDVMMKFYQNQRQFKGQSSLKTYLVKMTVNRSHDYLRSWKSKGLVLVEKLRGISAKRSPEQQMIKNEDNQVLVKAMFSMTLIYREVLILYYFEELSTVEIAGLLSCPEATIRTRLQRGRRQLKQRLQDENREVMYDVWNEG
ncbi:sigma-70 family RNA polymerase sigma factor [Sporosarcina sp.]|uniref:sigma-70 family RNA polymerase sigma factor n=1 Tax=Sporosarcina sp. TaxID=49982 RepID=UPI00262C6656|nr:sigma-70 family RNA polymerase sigma factor [Sporosarcina sp.]